MCVLVDVQTARNETVNDTWGKKKKKKCYKIKKVINLKSVLPCVAHFVYYPEQGREMIADIGIKYKNPSPP